MIIHNDLRKIIVALLRDKFHYYLSSKNFEYTTIELAIDDLWSALMNKRFEDTQGVRDLIPYGEDEKEVFIAFANNFYRKDAKLFLKIISHIIADFIKNNNQVNNVNIILKELHNLGTSKEDIELIKVTNETALTNIKSKNVEVELTLEGIYLQGQYYDALNHISKILDSANKSLMIIDNYANEKILNLINPSKKLNIKILTKDVNATFKEFANAYKKQYSKIQVRVSNKFHDRFIIIDDSVFFHFGASLKDLGNKAFMFSRIQEEEILNLFKGFIQNEWENAEPIV